MTYQQSYLIYQINLMTFWRDKSYFLRPSNYEKPINAQHHQQESEEVNPAPALKLNICKALSLNGNEVNPDNLQVYYC